MPDFQKLIQMLQSPKASKRYDACEELRVAKSLPNEALEALKRATEDPNPDVAEAARHALDMHILPPRPNENLLSSSIPPPKPNESRLSSSISPLPITASVNIPSENIPLVTPLTVKIQDFNMPFWSLVGFLIKVALASIPAMVVIMIVYAFLWVIFGSLVIAIISK